MREINYKCWDKERNEMCLVLEIGLREKWVKVSNGDSTFRYIAFSKCELLEYTGLKDKNGKEIYEGDIVKGLAWYQGKKLYSIDELSRVTYEAPSFKFGHTSWEKENIEVVGNIYENPELLI